MSAWLEGLGIGWLIVVVLACTFAVAAAIQLGVARIARGERAAAVKAVSPGMLPPMGLHLDASLARGFFDQ